MPYTVPGMSEDAGRKVAGQLQKRLTSLIDLALTLKHVHWNVVGAAFIGVHEMLDPQVDGVREMVDETAERIATLGHEPIGTPGFVSTNRTWDDYSLRRATVPEHLAALNLAYDGVIRDHRRGIDEFDSLDPVSQDMLIEQTERLEKYQWFVRAHLEDRRGDIAIESRTERGAAAEARGKAAS